MTAGVFSNKVVRRRAITFSVLLAVSFVLMAISSSPIVIELQKGVAFAFSPVQGLLDAWARDSANDFPNYVAGTAGPDAADRLLTRDGREWLSIKSGHQHPKRSA